MEKRQVIERFCKLATDVNEKKFGFEVATDCFCGGNPTDANNYRFDEQVMDYIEKTVRAALSV